MTAALLVHQVLLPAHTDSKALLRHFLVFCLPADSEATCYEIDMRGAHVLLAAYSASRALFEGAESFCSLQAA